MFLNRLRDFTLHWLTACLLLAASSSAAAGFTEDVNHDLATGKVIVLIINADETRQSEQYADWSYYLNEFAREAGLVFSFYKVSSDDLASLVTCSKRYDAPYSMIFMRNDEVSLFHEGPILEPQIYEYVSRFYGGESMPEHLDQFAPPVVQVDLIKH